MLPKFEFFQRHRDYAPVFLRLIIGSFIIYGVQDNIFSYAQMEEFARFLEARHVPFPLFAAFLSAYVQFICGVSILLGAFVRLTAIPFIVNFIAAVIIAHRADTFSRMFPALLMICVGLFFLFNGAGRLSIDAALERQRDKEEGERLAAAYGMKMSR